MRYFLLVIVLLFTVIYSQNPTKGKGWSNSGDEESDKQKVFLTIGPEVNVLIPTNFGNSDVKGFKDNSLLVPNDSLMKVIPNPSFRIGACLRLDFSKTISFQTGLYYLTRNYTTRVGFGNAQNTDLENHFFEDKYQFIGFEIPLQALIYVRLGKNFYMNNAVGIGLEFYPSSVQRITTDSMSFSLFGGRNSWIMPTVKASIGFEYRTENAGYFYLGGGFNRPFLSPLLSIAARPYALPFGVQGASLAQSGTYFSIDFKYFFPPSKKNKWTEK